MESNPMRSDSQSDSVVHWDGRSFRDLLNRCRQQLAVVQHKNSRKIGLTETVNPETLLSPNLPFKLLGILPPLYPEWLGDRSFQEDHQVRFPYIAGAMANGISSLRMVSEMAANGFLSFFGSAGLSRERVEATAIELGRNLGSHSWGMNLIYTPHESGWENAVVDCYLRNGVRKISASAYMQLSPAIVWYACKGLKRREDGQVLRLNSVFAKISRPEVARRFMEPAPKSILNFLVDQKKLTREEADLACEIPLAQDITAESDSGGHTDNQPLCGLFPSISKLGREICEAQQYSKPFRIGAAGGLGTPDAVAAAFAMGASYVVTGSVNQSCVESGLDHSGKLMLAKAELKDMKMAPAADMFEMGVQVQVLSRGTFFPFRAKKLYELYRSHSSLSSLPKKVIEELERDFFRSSIKDAWESTRQFWEQRDRSEVIKAEKSAKHKMALLFRSYLGLSSKWAIQGNQSRQSDFQIWCGPAQAAFNSWVRGSFLEQPEQRTVVQVARNLMEGAAVLTRINQLRTFGVPVHGSQYSFKPRFIS